MTFLFCRKLTVVGNMYINGQKNGVGKYFLLTAVNTAEELWFYLTKIQILKL